MKKSNRHHALKKTYICPNWPGYWEQAHGLRKPPNWVDFSCHKKRPPDGISSQVLFDTGFFRFDMMNMNHLREDAAPKFVGEDTDAQNQFAQQVRKLKAGEINYFVMPVHCRHKIGQVPEGSTLFEYPSALKPQERHVSIFVREEGPLMPDVLCGWMEKLSPVLFGFSAHYLIPKNQWWSKARTKKYFCYPDKS